MSQDTCARCPETSHERRAWDSIGAPVAGTSEEREFNDALDCAFSAPNRGTSLLADAVEKGNQIKNAAA